MNRSEKNKNELKRLGRNIRLLRQKEGYTQEELAKAAKMPLAVLQAVEAEEEVETFEVEYFFTICTLLKKQPKDMFF